MAAIYEVHSYDGRRWRVEETTATAEDAMTRARDLRQSRRGVKVIEERFRDGEVIQRRSLLMHVDRRPPAAQAVEPEAEPAPTTRQLSWQYGHTLAALGAAAVLLTAIRTLLAN